MAGRPSPGGSTSVLIGLCVAIGVALVTSVLLVILWTNQEELKNAAAEARKVADRAIKRSEMQGTLKDWYDLAGDRESLARLMYEELLTLGQTVSTTIAEARPGIAETVRDNQVSAFWSDVRNDGLLGEEQFAAISQQPLLDALRDLYDQYSVVHQAQQESKALVADLTTQNTELTELNARLSEDFQAKTTELQEQVSAMEDEWREFRAEKNAQFSTMMESTEQQGEQYQQKTEELRERIALMSNELEKKEERNRDLQSKLSEFQIRPHPRLSARQFDGNILLAKPGSESVFIDLGINDNLVLGLRFAVYPPDPGIPGSGEAKAAIEVVNIGDEVSECRIRWMNELFPILEGDLIANPIYDRDRQMTFVVIGEYDLDHDGLDDFEGAGVIRSFILDFGGQVVEAVSPRVDFVIVGARPLIPRLGSDPSADDEAVHDSAVRRVEAFNASVSEALSLSIPVLTQETFLNFLGRRT